MAQQKILITGGTRSGKSSFALTFAQPPRLFVATAAAKDREMHHRISRHQAERGEGWDLLESPLLSPRELQLSLGNRDYQWVVIDCITIWVSNLLMKGFSRSEILNRVESTMKVAEEAPVNLVCVTSEVGMGIVPVNPLARRYRDILGEVNKLVAARASSIYLMVAGVPTRLK
jgi:adenosyl cobinamide kinase/adenosyl cobinamide phosphate guanylyltransferase